MATEEEVETAPMQVPLCLSASTPTPMLTLEVEVKVVPREGIENQLEWVEVVD